MIGEAVPLGAFTDHEQLLRLIVLQLALRANSNRSVESTVDRICAYDASHSLRHTWTVFVDGSTGDTHRPFQLHCIDSNCVCTTVANSAKPGFEPPTSTPMGVLHQGFCFAIQAQSTDWSTSCHVGTEKQDASVLN